MKLIQSAILKNVLLTSVMVGTSVSAVMIIENQTETFDTLGYNPNSPNAVTAVTKKESRTITRRATTSFNNNVMPVVSTNDMTSISATPTSSNHSTVSSGSVSNYSTSISPNMATNATRSSSTSGNNGAIGLLAQSNMIVRSSLSGGNNTQIAAPFGTDARPNVGIQRKGIDYGTGEPFPDEEEPLGDGLFIMALFASAFIGLRKLKVKKA